MSDSDRSVPAPRSSEPPLTNEERIVAALATGDPSALLKVKSRMDDEQIATLKAELLRRSPSVPTATRDEAVHKIEQRFFSTIMRLHNSDGNYPMLSYGLKEAINERRAALDALPPFDEVKIVRSASSEEAATSTQPEISLDEAIAALRRHGFATVATLAEHARRESATARVLQGEDRT